jgi:hypothetical protein
MTDGKGPRETPRDVHALLERIDESWRAFMAALDGIPEERQAEGGVAGEWSLQNLFGHIAFWDREAIGEIERALAGLPRGDNDWQAMNEADHAARRGRSLAEERSAMHQAHAALVERLEQIAGLDAARIDEAVKGGSYEHYEEHIPDVEQWRQQAGV